MVYFLPEIFSHPSLTSLSLSGYTLERRRAFINCGNLKTLKLLNMFLFRVSTLRHVLAACSSLEVIVLEIFFVSGLGVLKIGNKNLKFLQVTFPDYVERIEVNAPCLDVLDIRDIKCESKNNFILTAPNIQFDRNYWVSRCVYRPHISYNVSELVQVHSYIFYIKNIFYYSNLNWFWKPGKTTNKKQITNLCGYNIYIYIYIYNLTCMMYI